MYLSCPPYMPNFLTHVFFLDLIIRKMFGKQYISQSSSLCSRLHFHAISSLLGVNTFLGNTNFKHPLPTFGPQCKRPSFTPVQDNRRNFSFVCLNLHICRQQTGRQKILHRIIARIPSLQSDLYIHERNFDLLRLYLDLRGTR